MVLAYVKFSINNKKIYNEIKSKNGFHYRKNIKYLRFLD